MIIPSIIAKNQSELNKRFNKVKSLSNNFHLDIMDGKFVKEKSLNFNFKLPKRNYSAHLMLKDPTSWIKKNSNKVNTIFIQYESNHLEEAINLAKSKHKKIGLALNPKTKIIKIIPYLHKIDSILILTVNPGRYGSKFIPSCLKKIKQAKKIKKELKVYADGSINNKTIRQIKPFKPDNLIVGSYLINSNNPKQALKELR